MIDTERKEDLFLDTKLIKSENRLGKLRIIDELHPVLGGQPTHEANQPNDNNPFLDLACTMQFTIDKVNAVDKKADTKLAKAQNLKDVADVAIARDNLGLGTSATMNATSTLSDRTDQTATPKMVNDVNRDVVTAQKTANTANDKANAAQTRADSAYNLANTANNNANTRLEKSKNLSDLTNVATARNNLGLGNAATKNMTSSLGNSQELVASQALVNSVNSKIKLNTASKAQNGWWKCGDTGLIYQWGLIKDMTNNERRSVTFPISFTHSVFSISCAQFVKEQTIRDNFLQVVNADEKGFIAYNNDTGGVIGIMSHTYIAIGY